MILGLVQLYGKQFPQTLRSITIPVQDPTYFIVTLAESENLPEVTSYKDVPVHFRHGSKIVQPTTSKKITKELHKQAVNYFYSISEAVQGVGMGDGSEWLVYVSNYDENIPKTYEGFPINVIVSGKIEIQ